MARATFDNIYVPFDCNSTIATFATPTDSSPESVGTVTVNIPLTAAATVNGTYTVTVANGLPGLPTAVATTTPRCQRLWRTPSPFLSLSVQPRSVSISW
ncbi:MAG: hypothetical protein IPI55_06895 [Flavobacteriales bacterium]|nr:hypothetical protein [Flavobacteriales bacterium]